MAGIATDKFVKVEIASAGDLRAWLEAHHQQSESVWLVTWKKSVPDKFVSRDEVLDELVAFGWIDGVRRKLDDHRTMQLIAPRQQQAWMKSYKDRAEALEKAGRMHAAGRASVAAGKASGLWDFFDDVDRLIVPDDFASELEARGALTAFHSLGESYRRNVLRWIKIAKTDATRKKRIVQAAEVTAGGGKLPQM